MTPRHVRHRPARAAPASLALLALLVAGASPALSGADPVRETLSRHLAANGLGWSDLPAFAEVVDVDASGAESRRLVPTEEAIALLAEGAPPAPRGPGPAHVVTGGVRHACSDPIRYCYFYRVVAEAEPAYSTARAPYEGATSGKGLPRAVSPFPLAGNATLRVWGAYASGTHAANDTLGLGGVAVENGLPGDGSGHLDHALDGAGVGSLRLVAWPWGPNLVISYGRLSAIGQFTFCASESASECHVQEALGA